MANIARVASDAYYENITLNADGSVSYTLVPVPDPLSGGTGIPSQQTRSAEDFEFQITMHVRLVLNGTYSGPGYLDPSSFLALDVAVHRGLITAEQLQQWLTKVEIPIGGIKGFTKYDYNPATPIPSILEFATSPSLWGTLNTSDVRTVNTVQQVNAQIEAAAKALPALSANQELVTKLYLAAFLRAPEKSGLDFWSDMLDTGSSLTQVGHVIFSLPVVQAIYSLDMTNREFVTAIYDNVFGRDPDAEGLAYWLDRMDGGEQRGDLVMSMMNAGLATAIGTPGRDYVMNRYETVNYAVKSQVKAGAEIAIDTLFQMTDKVGADAAAITTYQQGIDAQLVGVVGTYAAPVEGIFG